MVLFSVRSIILKSLALIRNQLILLQLYCHLPNKNLYQHWVFPRYYSAKKKSITALSFFKYPATFLTAISWTSIGIKKYILANLNL
jgi:hypothetical protein